MTRLERLQKRLEDTQRRIQLERESERARNANKPARRKPHNAGRPPISAERLLEIENEAYKKPLDAVALKFGVSRSTLHKYGITRENLNRKLEEAARK